MLHRVYAIALNTFREAIRQRILYGIIVVIIGVIAAALVLGEMSLRNEARVTRDLGLAGVSLGGSIIAIVLGVTLLYAEIQRRTIHSIVSKPLQRYEFVLGKYVGMFFTLSVLVALFGAALSFILLVQGLDVTASVAKALVLSYFEVLVVAAVAVFFSSFSSPFLSGIFSFGLFIVGRVTPEMRDAIATAKSETIRLVCNAALHVVPDLHLFSVSGGEVRGEHVTVHAEFVSWTYVATAGAYAAFWVAILMLLASLIFGRRDFA